MTVQDIREIKLHEDEDWEIAKEEMFGKSYFLAKTVSSPEIRVRVAGKLKRPKPLEPGQKRRRFEERYVVQKPNRQEGAKPKTRKTVSIDQDLLIEADQRMEADGQWNFSEFVETAISFYLQSPK